MFELIVVVGVIASLTAVSVPVFTAYQSTWRLNSSGRELYNAVLQAKNSAVRYNAQCVVEFTPGTYTPKGGEGSFRVFLDTDKDWTDTDASGQPERVFIVPLAMPGKISLYSAVFTDNGNGLSTARTMAGFDSRGRAARAAAGTFVSGVVLLRNDKNRYRRITVNPVGTIYLEKSKDGSTWEE